MEGGRETCNAEMERRAVHGGIRSATLSVYVCLIQCPALIQDSAAVGEGAGTLSEDIWTNMKKDSLNLLNRSSLLVSVFCSVCFLHMVW